MLLSRACPGLFTLDQILHHISRAQGNELIHAGRLHDGEPMIWPNPHLSKRGRWWEKVVTFLTRKPNELAHGTAGGGNQPQTH